ncbi:hypothetical protein EV182_002416 [Spiromyces aspiralis]|uniref:Uncharacterized protein n=1 Tax=Spiromyces aspiralis TaxID=68401 RepID=A0ACC1HHS3_9FUNG|nr:hypothetical protein EV182_002416 [Spiromyces aspiralis]
MGPAYSGVGQGALCEADERGIREGVLMGGMVEKEDVVALGAYLDGIEKEQQASTSPGLEEAIQRGGDGEDALSTPDKLYVSLFPHMPEFVAAVVGLVSSWIPLIDEAVDQQRMALKSAGSQASKPSSQKKPQPSTSYSEGDSGDQSSGARSTLSGAYETQNDYTCHRNERGPQASAKVPLTYQTRTAARSRRDSDASMSTLASNTTATDQAHVSSHAAPPRFSKTEATLRRAMYAQCRQVGGLVSLILRALQCMHVLKMEYFGHLLVTNKWITQTLKWIGFLDLEYLIKVPPLAHKLTFSRHSLKFIEGAILRDATARGNATSDSANTFRGKLKAMAATTDILFDPSGLQGLYDMISTLRLLTHRHILRRYLLAHNMGLVFLKKLYGIDNTAFRRLVCEIIKDIFPFERRNWRTPNHGEYVERGFPRRCVKC